MISAAGAHPKPDSARAASRAGGVPRDRLPAAAGVIRWGR